MKSEYDLDSFFGTKITTVSDVITQFRVGIKIEIAERLRNKLGLTTAEFSHAIGISRQTYDRRRKFGRMTSYESDKIYRIHLMLNFAVQVLENKQEAIRWLMTENTALNHEIPIMFCDTYVGYNEVVKFLGRVEYDVYS